MNKLCLILPFFLILFSLFTPLVFSFKNELNYEIIENFNNVPGFYVWNDQIFVVNGSKLYKSSDGENWTFLYDFRGKGQIIAYELFVSSKGYIFVPVDNGTTVPLYRSIDGGSSFQKVFSCEGYNINFSCSWFWRGFTEDEQGNLLFGVYYGPHGAYIPACTPEAFSKPYIWKSSDDGANWVLSFNGTEVNPYLEHVHMVQYDIYTKQIYAVVDWNMSVSKTSIYISQDANNWKLLDTLVRFTTISFDENYMVLGVETPDFYLRVINKYDLTMRKVYMPSDMFESQYTFWVYDLLYVPNLKAHIFGSIIKTDGTKPFMCAYYRGKIIKLFDMPPSYGQNAGIRTVSNRLLNGYIYFVYVNGSTRQLCRFKVTSNDLERLYNYWYPIDPQENLRQQILEWIPVIVMVALTGIGISFIRR